MVDMEEKKKENNIKYVSGRKKQASEKEQQ